MRFRISVRRILWGVAVSCFLLLLTGGAFYAGIQVAEDRATTEMNALMKAEETLYRYYLAHGRFPVPSTDLYEFRDLTVSDVSDTSVSYYSGVERTRLITLHVRPSGYLVTSRR